MEYKEAVALAKSVPGSIMTRNPSGDGFIVRFAGQAEREDKLEKEIERLNNQIAMLKARLAKVSEENNKLQAELQPLLHHNDIIILERLKSEKVSLDETQKALMSKEAQLDNEIGNVKARLKEIELLKHAYRQKFGEAEVKTIEESVQSKVICSRCGGDGGVKGGCQNCDGTGWATSTQINYRDVVEFK